MADPRIDLPAGRWTVRRFAVRPPRVAEEPPTFWIYADDAGTGDRVRAYFAIGDLCDYSAEDWGLPEDLPSDKLWYLARIEPRDEKARGGTAALLRALGRFADAEGIWVTTEVKTGADTRNALVRRVLTAHAAFFSPDAEYADMMTRRPSPTGPVASAVGDSEP